MPSPRTQSPREAARTARMIRSVAPQPERQCFFCTSSHKFIDHKDAETLRRFMNFQMKIMPRRRTGLCALHQRALANAIKRARELGLLAYNLY